MELLFKREQTSGRLGRVNFKLWGKVELDEEEKALVKRYRFDEAALIVQDQPKLLRQCAVLGLLVAFGVYLALGSTIHPAAGFIAGVPAGIGFTYWRYNEKRETIYVRDLLHGRFFNAATIVDLVHKEFELSFMAELFRQVMESAKYWDDTERQTVEAMPKEDARRDRKSVV